MSGNDADAMIRELAAGQHGLVARPQLLAAGMTPARIDHRLRSGRLTAVHRAVYHAGPIRSRWHSEMAAVLACGPGAVLSDRTAAEIAGMMPRPRRGAPVDVAGPRTLRGPGGGVRLHRRGLAVPDEVARLHGLPVTTPARTLLDLASSLGPYELERAMAVALRRSLLDHEAIEAMLSRYPGRRGCRVLRSLLDPAAEPALTRSEAEARFLALLRKGGVPRPRVNGLIAGLEVDFLWPDRRLVAEIDGFAYHSHRSAFEHDRRRDAILAAEGFSVVRFTWRQIEQEPTRVLARLCLALGARTPLGPTPDTPDG